MAQTETQKDVLESGASFKTEKIENPAQQLDTAVNGLVKYGGFDFIESLIDGSQNLNPSRKARKKIFLTDMDKKSERSDLYQKLNLWLVILSESQNAGEMVDKCNEKNNTALKCLTENQKKAVDAVRDLETSYRSLSLFYNNTEGGKLKNVTIVNASMEQLKDLDNPRFIDHVQGELKQNFDRLDLRDNYSILCIPGYLGSNKVVEKWAKIAHENKVMLVTDFENLDSPDDVMDLFESANLTGGDIYRSNVMMTCNWLLGREKYKELGEEDDLSVPPSAALAGKLYKTLMSQVTAGKKHGGMNEVSAVKFDLKKSEIAQMEKAGLIPMVNEYGKVMAFSAKTLFNGDNLGLQTYSVVRVFDYINKTLMDFLNRRAFENFNAKTQRELRDQITGFLDDVCGPDNLIEKFEILRLEQDPNQKDRVFLDIHITPYFPAKNFLIKLDGTKGEEATGVQWNSSVEQEK